MDAEDLLATLGAELTRLKAAKQWSVGYLAGHCGRSRTTVSQALNTKADRPIPSVDTVVAICDALGADHKPLVELLRRAKTAARVPPSGPRARDRSRQFAREADHLSVIEPAGVYDPLRRENLLRSVQWALEAAPPIPLTRAPSAGEAGIYALYYTGPHELYRPVLSSAASIPLYVGKAMSLRGSSRPVGGSFRGELSRALAERRRSLEDCENLDVSDFLVRYLPVDRVWVTGGEQLMIGDHRPVWNTILPGFGRHSPSAHRGARERSPWDELHPGRQWATRMLPCRRSVEELRIAVQQHLTESLALE
ncbi:Eco29kI family restriction endonuclease [Amycolatopsis sp. cmx-4-68]|uniref:Eco29kI family restriction endonuclease n=1 Tax=Amycolatopsis sp. cmx-4-68 TaxID=2790938 RepID=UPI003978F1F7